ncbi:YbbR-like domain-containing protein [Lachnoanaerobaculum orale]|uniref:CdaR family protein n=1 Tax=Lachnoanaerobaculum orale TaxID=979627 RepID=UPI0023A89BBA|nr:CdaR family protein [Lachnoanaerobaculum orale]
MIKTNNLVLKISSLAVAFLVWIIVVNVSNPIVTRNISVPLNVVNANIITDAGKTYSLTGANSVTVSYEVRSRDQSRISASDFNASIDLGDMYDITGAVPIAVEVVNNKDLIIGAVASKPSIVRVSIEDLQRKEFTLTTKITGTPSDGFSVGEVKLDKTNVVVTGPVSVIGQISQIGVEIDVSGLDSDESGRAELKYFDANGNAFVISDSRVSKSFDNVGYSLVMLNGRTLALNFDVGGTAAQGYKFTGAESTTKSIQVRGQPEVLEGLDSITVPASALSVEGATGDVNITVDIKNFLPANVTAVGDTKVNVTLKVEALDKKSLTLTVNDLNIVGAKPGAATNIVPEKITVVVSGLSANLESVTNADLKATLDVSEMNVGSNTGSLKFEPATGLSVDSYTPFEVIIGNHTSEKNETTTAAEQSSVETAASAEN